MNTQNSSVTSLRKELRSSMGDRNKLSKLHTIVTENINNTYGEEKQTMLELRQEIKDALNCRVLDRWS